MEISNIVDEELRMISEETKLDYNVVKKLFDVSYSVWLNLGKYNKEVCENYALSNVKDELGGKQNG